jgi:large subunit ribosomal protein L9
MSKITRNLLLKADVPAVGKIGDLVKVKDGFARNYLLPMGLAIEPTPANIKRVEEEKKIVEAKRAQELAEKRAMADRLNGIEISILSKANEQGILFGSIGPKEIADALKAEGYNVEPKFVTLVENIKQIGTNDVTLNVAPEVSATIKVTVAQIKDGSEENA